MDPVALAELLERALDLAGEPVEEWQKALVRLRQGVPVTLECWTAPTAWFNDPVDRAAWIGVHLIDGDLEMVQLQLVELNVESLLEAAKQAAFQESPRTGSTTDSIDRAAREGARVAALTSRYPADAVSAWQAIYDAEPAGRWGDRLPDLLRRAEEALASAWLRSRG